MSAAALTPGAPGMIDISGSAKVPFSRLVRVELRKMADTRAGFWLLTSIALITAAILVIFLLVAVIQAGPAEMVGRCFAGLEPLTAYRYDLAADKVESIGKGKATKGPGFGKKGGGR